jgi:hypothetical protein
VRADPVPDRESPDQTDRRPYYRWAMPDEAMDAWWNSLTADQQAEAVTIPQKLPDWMSTNEKATEILAHWQVGSELPGEYMSDELREYLESKRTL